MKRTAKQHKKEPGKEHQDQQLQDRLGLQPEFISLEKPSLAYFDLWYRYLLTRAFEHRVEKNLRAAGQRSDFRETLTDIMICQQIYALESATIKFLHGTSLKMCEAALASDTHSPELPRPGHSLWLQPLVPLTYRNEQIVGIFLYRPFDAVFLEQSPYLRVLSHRDRAWLHDFLDSEAGRMTVNIITSAPVSKGENMDRITTHQFGEFQDASWRRIDVQNCPMQRCVLESLDEGGQLPVLCSACAEELDYWSRVITTLLWITNGRLRQPHDTKPSAEYSETLEQKDLFTRKTRKRRYTGEIIQYEASYFRPKPTYHTGPLSDTHRIVSPSEAEKLEVDEEHILVPDWTDIEDFMRTLRDPKYYPGGVVPTDVLKLRRVPVRGRKGKRQLISLELWKAREARRATQRKQQLVHASTPERDR